MELIEGLFNLKLTQKRLLAMIMLAIFLFVLVSLKLAHVSIIDGNLLQTRAISQWTRGLPLIAERGKFLDANGNALAVSYTTFDVYVRAKEVDSPTKVASVLSALLNVTYDFVLEKANNKNISESKIKSQISGDLAAKIGDNKLAGVFLSENSKRYYPYGDLMTQLLGFTTIDGVGQSGLEAYFQQELSGLNGRMLVESDLQGKELDNTLRWYLPSVAGMDITLTIDARIQLAAEQALVNLMADQKPKNASAIVMNAKTGEILAMASKPSFDLNEPPRNDLPYLLETMKNKNIVDIYEPGSTFKVLTMASALESGVAKLTDTFYDPGYRMVDGEKIKCWKLTGHGHQTLTDGMCNSCNSVFVDLALRMGIDTFYSWLGKMGIGNKTGIDFLGESAGMMMNTSDARRVDLARMGFGQAIAVTPLQLVTAFAAAVTGNLPQPHFVQKISAPSGKEVLFDYSTKSVFSTQTSQIVCNMLEETVSKTGKLTFIPGYQLGGKTGTSQKYENGRIVQKFVSSFIGMYPTSDPEYIVYVVADEPSKGQYYGSVVATPYAKQIFQGIFDAKNIAPVNQAEDMEKVALTITMPSLVGKSLTEASNILLGLKLHFEIDGEGGIVTHQFVPAGTLLFENYTVVIQCAT